MRQPEPFIKRWTKKRFRRGEIIRLPKLATALGKYMGITQKEAIPMVESYKDLINHLNDRTLRNFMTDAPTQHRRDPEAN